MLKITRQSDTRYVRGLIGKIADIPNGITIKTSLLGGAALYEGTPITKSKDNDGAYDGLYEVVKTAKVHTAYTAAATTIKVLKGHHFKVGDVIGNESLTVYATITAIDTTTNAAYDTITFTTGFSANIAKNAILIKVTATKDNTVEHTGTIIVAATNSATEYIVAKGHNFIVGDHLTDGTNNAQTITEITEGLNGDTLTVGTTLGGAITAYTDVYAATAAGGTTKKTYTETTIAAAQEAPIALVGENQDVETTTNLAASAWLMAVAKEDMCPPVTAAHKTALKTIHYI
jgi:hypothetical protein